VIVFLASLASAQTAPAPAPAPTAQQPAAHKPAPHTDKAIHTAVDQLYGKDIPTAGVCIDRDVELPAYFGGDPVPVGVKRGAKGCTLVGVMVGGMLRKPESASVASLDPEAWKGLDGPTRAKVLVAWTDQVLLAFAAPDGADIAPAKVTKTAITFARGYVRRDEPSRTTVHAIGNFAFALDGTLTGTPTEKVDKRWTTSTYTRAETLIDVDQNVVETGLETKGGIIRECFAKVWEHTPDLTGRVVLRWSINEGKTENVSLVNMPGDATPNKNLANCYANAVNGIQWPSAEKGEVVWVFAIDRREVAPSG